MRTLGRSGLIVSPLMLGTMTFGNSQWGSPPDVAAAIFNAYVEAGGNVIDTADVYADGRSEEIVGKLIAQRGLRDAIVLATKSTFHDGDAANVNAGGNGRKHLYRALEGSLRRLGTDFVDLYWLHAWDTLTPVDEVLQTLGDLVRAGKIRYFGFSDVPAWYAAKAATLAAAHAIPGPIALQLEYSLVERSIEREHLPAARECGLGVCAWSPLAGGFLSGKYRRPESGADVDHDTAERGRLDAAGWQREKSERHWRVLAALEAVAAQLQRPLAHVALAWAAAQPGLTSLILGARTLEQLQQNLACAGIVFTVEQARSLAEASALDDAHPYGLFGADLNRDYIFGGTPVAGSR